jgi:hypothetical protein
MRTPRLAIPVLAAIAACTFASAPLHAVYVRQMTLPELVANADRIVRGTVIAGDDTTVSAGGGQLPATAYRIRVAEMLKGAPASGDLLDVRLLARPKAAPTGSLRRGTLLQDVPEFRVGQEYLFLLTRPSAVGLSTTVGLGQGLFELRGRGSEQVAVNGANNVGLFGRPDAAAAAAATPGATARSSGGRSAGGPVAYNTLASEIRALAAR